MRKNVLMALVFATCGCRGPLAVPAFRRLSPEEQAQVDQIWNNVLEKSDRLDRELLLDVIIAYQLHASGIDRASYHAEKNYSQGSVVMDVRFDRSKPLDDWFFLEVRDRTGNVLRTEKYAGDEVWSHADALSGFGLAATSQPVTDSFVTTQPISGSQRATNPASTERDSGPSTEPTRLPSEEALRELRLQIRYEQIISATQPVRH